jgi:hypothetical protein
MSSPVVAWDDAIATPPEFEAFPKIPRLFGDIVITEKIDGTNGLIYIDDYGEFFVGSRTRWIGHHQDNKGFHAWAVAHKQELLQLGPGRHHGEWWGSGIGRGYGLTKGEKRFSLFNVSRWYDVIQGSLAPACCHVVPILYQGQFTTDAVLDAQYQLRSEGSVAAPGFANPEGVMVYHVRAGSYLKAPLDPLPKGPHPE